MTDREEPSDAPMQFVISVLRELDSIGVWHAINGCENWDAETIVQAVKYRRATGHDPVRERHMIMDAERGLDDCRFQIDRDTAEIVLAGGCWAISEAVKESLEQRLREADYRESYGYRREQANLHIAKKSVRKQIFKRDGNCCVRCGRTERLSIDHVLSVANGGGNEDENLQTLCVPCNSSKGSERV